MCIYYAVSQLVSCVSKFDAQMFLVLVCKRLSGLIFTYIHVLQGLMKLDRQQILSLFIKVMKKFYKYLYAIASEEIESTLPRPKEVS